MPDTLTIVPCTVEEACGLVRTALRDRLWALLPRAHGGSAEAAAEAARLLEALGWMRGLDARGRAMVAEAWGIAEKGGA
ncbi:MAG: hypothetical protein KGK07_15640 [Chloroflexota bacterium]|nr:hypothetical protein [Chloroflexota bacterium]